ncbi:MAG: M48 family metallopeptidase [Pyrinomonadaceae bacterium]|nr:M48 family metallopeptidase [Pyrinomonadaceae bacterium]
MVALSDIQTRFTSLYADAFRQLDPKRPPPPIEVRLYPYAGLNHTIRLRGGRVYVRVSDIFRDAPMNVQRALAFILVAKLLRRRTPQFQDRVYRDFACTPQILRASDIARRRRGRKIISSARGAFYNLERMFERLNRRFFDDQLKKPTLTWSQRRTRRILGHHDPVHQTIVISKTLDARDVPEWFVEYILYHEMLHIKHPARIIKGRRFYHTKTFRAEEERFPYYVEAQEWLERISLKRRTHQRARAA